MPELPPAALPGVLAPPRPAGTPDAEGLCARLRAQLGRLSVGSPGCAPVGTPPSPAADRRATLLRAVDRIEVRVSGCRVTCTPAGCLLCRK